MTAFRSTGFQPCTATMHEWWMSGDRDPEVAIRADQIQAWIGLWHKADAKQKRDIREAWRITLERRLPKPKWDGASLVGHFRLPSSP